MSIDAASDNEPEAQTLLQDKVVPGFIGFSGSPALRSKSGNWKSASFIIGGEVTERFIYFGISSNLISYLTGPLGQSTAAAAVNANTWLGACMFLPFLGGYVADSFMGRYHTIIVASLLYILGLGCLSLSAALHSSNSSSPPPLLEVILFFSSLYLIAFALGGHKPCLQSFGADQFDEDDVHESKSKRSFFNWWNFWLTLGALVSMMVLIYIQENISWMLGFGISCIAMCFSLLIFLLGSRTYRFRINSDEGNPFIRIGRALLVSSASDEDTAVCRNRDIDDAKVILRLVPIWCACLGYAVVFSQSSTFFTKQGATMDRYITRSFQIPAASLQAFIALSIFFFIPLYDLVLVPIARGITKRSGGISMLQRIGMGIFTSFISMVTAAVIEKRRLATAAKYGLVDKPTETIPMSIWWLVPQYLLFGVTEVFVVVGLQEFFYDQIPRELKSIGVAVYFSVLGTGNFLSGSLISVIEKATGRTGHESWFSNNLNRAHLDYFYWLLACLSAVTLVVYIYFARSFVYNQKGNV